MKQQTDILHNLDHELPQPLSQVQEVLFLLLTRGGQTRRDLMVDAWVLNAPQCISLLRGPGLTVTTKTLEHTNQFGRAAEYGMYWLDKEDQEEARQKYKQMVAYSEKVLKQKYLVNEWTPEL